MPKSVFDNFLNSVIDVATTSIKSSIEREKKAYFEQLKLKKELIKEMKIKDFIGMLKTMRAELQSKQVKPPDANIIEAEYEEKK